MSRSHAPADSPGDGHLHHPPLSHDGVEAAEEITNHLMEMSGAFSAQMHATTNRDERAHYCQRGVDSIRFLLTVQDELVRQD